MIHGTVMNYNSTLTCRNLVIWSELHAVCTTAFRCRGVSLHRQLLKYMVESSVCVIVRRFHGIQLNGLHSAQVDIMH